MSSPVAQQIRRHPIASFYFFAFTISWLGYVPLLAQASGYSFFNSPPWLLCLVLPAVGPALASLIVIAIEQSWNSSFRWLLRSFAKPVGVHWLLLCAFLPAVILFAARLLALRIAPNGAITPHVSIAGIAVFAVMSLAANPWEEVGWRGFALSRLEARHSGLASAIIVGVLWALWHVPLFLLHNNPMSMAHIPFAVWGAGVLGQSVLLAWVFNSTGRSLQAVTIFHVSGNIFAAIIGVPSFWTDSAMRIVAAIIVITLCGKQLRAQSDPLHHTPQT